MRILSQDGLYDFPYETSVLRICDCNDEKRYRIVANTSCIECYWNFGFYSSKEKAERAMEMLQNDYYDHVAEKTYHKGSYYIHPYFRFPADEDLEV